MAYTQRLTIRLTPYQIQVLDELSARFGSSYSLLVRTIIGHGLEEHEDEIEKIITENKEAKTLDDALNK